MKYSIIVFILAITTSIRLCAQQVSAEVVLSPMGNFKVVFSEVKGRAVINKDEVFIENTIVNLKSLKTGLELRDKHTLKHLEVDKNPEAILVKATGKGGTGKGVLKFMGTEKEISGKYSLDGDLLKAEFTLKLSDFGISDVNYMGVGVEDDVVIKVNLPATHASLK